MNPARRTEPRCRLFYLCQKCRFPFLTRAESAGIGPFFTCPESPVFPFLTCAESAEIGPFLPVPKVPFSLFDHSEKGGNRAFLRVRKVHFSFFRPVTKGTFPRLFTLRRKCNFRTNLLVFLLVFRRCFLRCYLRCSDRRIRPGMTCP